MSLHALSSKHVFTRGALSFTAQIANSAITYFAVIVIMRMLGEAQYGQFSYAIVVTGMTAMLADFGMNPIIFRRMAQEPLRCKQIILEATLLRVTLLLPTVALTNVVAFLQQQPWDVIAVLNVMLINVIISGKLQMVRSTFETLFRARARMHVPSLLGLLDSCVLLCFALIAPAFFSRPLEAMFVFTFSNLLGFVLIIGWTLALLSRERDSQWKVERASMKAFLAECVPVAAFLGLNAVHVYIDSLYLGSLVSVQALGEFNAALRLFALFLVLPTTVGMSFIPFIAQAHATANGNVERILRLYTVGAKSLLIVATCLGIAGWQASGGIVALLFRGEFSASVTPLIFFFLSYPFIALNLFNVEVNNALALQRRNTLLALLLAVFTLILGYPAIQLYGLLGAAAAKYAAVVCGFVFLSVLMHREIRWRFTPSALRTVAIAAICIGILFAMPAGMWLLRSAVVVAVFAVGIIATRYFTTDEIALWKQQLSPILPFLR